MKKTVLKFGLIAGTILSILFLLPIVLFEDNFDMGLGEVIGYSTMVLCLTSVFFGIRYYREKENGGTLTLGQGMMVGTLISVIAGIPFFIFNYIWFVKYGEKFLVRYREYLEKQVAASDPAKAAEEIKKLNEMLVPGSPYTQPWFHSLVMFVTVILIGVVIAFISSLILKKGKI